jgi:hypothetical protein
VSIVLFDVDGVLLRGDGTIRPGVVMTIRTLMALDYDIHFWSAQGEHHAHAVADSIGLGLPHITCHTKPPMPMAEFEGLRIIGERPALQIDDDRRQRIADWPFLHWTARR